ncbi:hypothetical protein [Pedobacter mucosus]|uniref:hypothetical protein n=1 Tax=Pedobacter mucosus TaxID=2895286 RepID=UPI001EE3ADED|nr:hypothetical protein [Pedobacter mucosus]UKT65331.1 hypothetical protein LOK61_06000 [Pedobacter mucosus]
METHIYDLFLLAIPVACIAWTVTKEEVFKEPREFCIEKSKDCKNLFQRKFFYLFTCEYCFSHYITILLLVMTNYKMLYPDWRGYVISGFSIVWVANVYMSLYNIIRVDLKKEKIRAAKEESSLKDN